MSFYHKSILFFLLLLPVFSYIHAAPAFPGLIQMKQPDGSELSLYVRGDEKIRWMESTDGYTLLYDNNKFITYAVLDEKGDMVPSSIVAKDDLLRSSIQREQLDSIPKKLFYSEKQIQIFNEIWDVRNTAVRSSSESGELRATVGTAYAICALVEFPDKPLTKTREDFELLLNQTGYNLHGAEGSVRDFYYENSYGQLELIIHVTGPYMAQNGMKYYGGNDDVYANRLASEVAQKTFSGLNREQIKQYDNNGDGYIDTFHFIYAGYGEEAGGPDSTIWAHKSSMFQLTFQGLRLNTYSCSPELRWNKGSDITHIGVICHELCHVFGAPDFYDANGNSGGEYVGTGKWDLMAVGSWNGRSSLQDSQWYSGSSPAHINMYQKIQFGWVSPETLNSVRFIDGMPNSAETPFAYTYATQTSGEYFVMENRQKKGFDSYIPGHGLLIYRVSIRNSDITGNSVNNTHQQRMYPICASATRYNLPINSPTSYGSINSAGCPFPGSSGKTEFTDNTIPASLSWSGSETNKPITNITEKNGLISFHFMKSVSVTDLTSSVEKKDNGSVMISLSWNPPASANPVKEYKIYRNNQFLQATEQTVFREPVYSEGVYIYQLSVVYMDGSESDRVTTEVVVNFTSIENVVPDRISDQAEFHFYSLQGQLLLRTKSKSFFYSSLPELKRGVYILRIKDQNRISNHKWIIR